ncbi:hypothetical protein [Streptomyces sp. NPDC095613]|uniref:hypothetical protein n=1 Tax=Streptomyces sp. NPDC095613 TaxID=3155540 RepID=UPI003326A1CD
MSPTPAAHIPPTAPPGPDTPASDVATGSSDVISLDARRPSRRGTQLEAAAVSTPDADSPEQQLAETIEALLLARGHSLTDETTSAVYKATVDAVLLMLEGAHAQGIVGEEQHATLNGMILGMREAPGRI